MTVIIYSFQFFGISDEIISDNSSQFMTKEHHNFATRYGFKLTTSNPHYSRGDSFMERQMQTTKNVFNRCAKDGSDPDVDPIKSHST